MSGFSGYGDGRESAEPFGTWRCKADVGHAHTLKRVGTVAACTAIVVWIAACNGRPAPRASPRDQPTVQTPSPSSVDITVAAKLKAAPSGCNGPTPRHRLISRHLAPLVGNRIVAAGFYARFEEPDSLHAVVAPRTRFGYRIKVLWVMPSRELRPVRVQGGGRGPHRLWFKVDEGGNPSSTLLLDPEVTAPSVEHPRWREYPSYLYVPVAGCYLLEASWGDGSWSIGIGLGT